MADIEHIHLKNLNRELHWEDGKWQHVLVIETDLELDASSSEHDAASVEKMVSFVVNKMKEAQKGFHRIIVRQVQ